MSGILGANDRSTDGFGASSAAFPAPAATFARLIRVLKASVSRIAITNIDVGWFVSGQAVSTTRIYTSSIVVFRQSPSNPIPDANLAQITINPVMPAGVECLFAQNIWGSVTTGTVGGGMPSNLSQNSFKFDPGVLSADASKILIVVATQPISGDGVAFVGGTTVLSVNGIDYGLPNTTIGGDPTQRSMPRML